MGIFFNFIDKHYVLNPLPSSVSKIPNVYHFDISSPARLGSKLKVFLALLRISFCAEMPACLRVFVLSLAPLGFLQCLWQVHRVVFLKLETVSILGFISVKYRVKHRKYIAILLK